jgi:hypothetical protein
MSSVGSLSPRRSLALATWDSQSGFDGVLDFLRGLGRSAVYSFVSLVDWIRLRGSVAFRLP